MEVFMTTLNPYKQVEILNEICEERPAQPEHYLPKAYRSIRSQSMERLAGLLTAIGFLSTIAYVYAVDHHDLMRTHSYLVGILMGSLICGTILMVCLPGELYRKKRNELLVSLRKQANVYIESEMKKRGVSLANIQAEINKQQTNKTLAEGKMRRLRYHYIQQS